MTTFPESFEPQTSPSIGNDVPSDMTFNFFGTSSKDDESSKPDFFDIFKSNEEKRGDMEDFSFRLSERETSQADELKQKPAKMKQSLGEEKKGPVGSHKRPALKNLDSPAKSDVGQLKKDGIEKTNEDPAPAAKRHCEEPWRKNNNLGADVAASHPKPQTKRPTHPLQVINEASPLGTQFRLPSLKEPTESLSSMSQKSTGEALIAKHSMGQRTQDGASSLDCVNQTSETETEALALALMSPEYEPLKEQLGNLQTAKQSGTFTSQVAVSVDALFKCFDREKNKDLSAIQSHQVKAVDKMNNMQETLQSQIQDLNAYHQALVDQKLSKLSTVLDEVKSCQDELGKFKHLLRSLTADINAEI